MLLKNKTAVITGGNRGIGAAAARLFAEHGAKVVVTHSSDRTRAEAEKVAGDTGGLAVACDVASREQTENLVARTVQEFGRLDVLVNNAGIMLGHRVENLDEAVVDAHLAVNVKGPLLMTAAALPELEKTRGTIVNTASLVGLSPSLVSDVYAATKHALVGLTRSWALDLASRGIRVNALAPGPVMTDLLKAADQATLDKMKALCPLGRLGKAEEMAQAMLFLASDMSSYVTGQTLVVDGGRFMH